MADPFLGEIRMFAGNFAPRGWAFCDGQLLSVSSYDALFSLVGTTYGGDGRTTFGLPDLRGRVPLHQGQGAGLSQRRIGQRGGAQAVTLIASQLPAHTHALRASTNPAEPTADPVGDVVADGGDVRFYAAAAPTASMDTASITPRGGSQSHENMAPSLGIHFIISLVGIYPSRT